MSNPMSEASLKSPLARAVTGISAKTDSNSNTDSDVLTSDLMRGTSLYQKSVQDSTATPTVTPQQQPSATFLGSRANLVSQHLIHTSGDASHTNTTLVFSQGSTPARHSMPPSVATPNVDHLSVESDSPVSLMTSIPFYNLSDYSRSLNTLNLLQSDHSRSPASGVPGVDNDEVAPDSRHRGSVVQISEQFNQVPQRFSQFILEQEKASYPPAASSIHSQEGRSRDISSSMGSQATIFSTRSEDGLTRIRLRSKKVSRAGDKAHLITDDSSSFLERRNAIKFKQGSALYRLRLTLRKLALKIKHKLGSIRHFFVGSRKATSRVQTASRKPFFGRSKSTSDKSQSARAAHISAPLANPQLGNEHGARKVEGLSDELKARAGAANVPGQTLTAQLGKTSPLSDYLAQQRHSGRRMLQSDTAFSEASVAPPPPPHRNASFKRIVSGKNEQARLYGVWKQYLSHVLASRIKLRQEVQLFQILLANQPIPSVFNLPPVITEAPKPDPSVSNARSSRRWSESVAEIKSHRASFVPMKYSSAESEADSYLIHAGSSLAPTAPSESPSHFTTDSLKHAAMNNDINVSDDNASIGTGSEDESSDEKINRLQQVLNRRSMLGEMLDYDSEELESLTSSTYSQDSVESSVEDAKAAQKNPPTSLADTKLVKRYGTLRRRHTNKSTFDGSLNGSSYYPNDSGVESKPISRSPGFNNLQLVSPTPDA